MIRLLILIAVAGCAAAFALFRWHRLLDVPIIPIVKPSIQSPFGMELTPGMLARLTRRLPDSFELGGSLKACIDRIRDEADYFHVRWTELKTIGVSGDAVVPARSAGGMMVGEMLLALCDSVHPSLALVEDDGRLFLLTKTDVSLWRSWRVYDLRDQLVRLRLSGSWTYDEQEEHEAALIRTVQANVAPRTWKDQDPEARNAMSILGGQLIVVAPPAVQDDVAAYLNGMRVRNARIAFARRAVPTVVGPAVITGALLVVHRRWRLHRRIRSGCCPGCGYDLRASPTICPECGIESRTSVTRPA